MKLLFYIRFTMKKIASLLFLTFLSFTTVVGQDYFESLSFQKALLKAKKKKKLLLVQLESPSCMQCNEVGKKGLSSQGVQEIVEKSFISVWYKPDSEDWKTLSKKYTLAFGTLFFDASGQLLHKYAQTTSSGEMYIAEIKRVQQKKKGLAQLGVFEKRYNNGEREYGFLRSFILAKINHGFRADTLVNDYLTSLPKDSLTKKENILFLANTAPMIDSFADSIMRSERTLFNTCWMSLPNTERVRINQAIIFHSRVKAIKEKNALYANRVANFTYNTYLPNREAGRKERDKQMIYYYNGIRDSSWLYVFCNFYADIYLMKPTKDSLLRRDSILKAKIFGRVEPPPADSIKAGVTKVQRTQFSFTPAAATVSNELRELANYIYYNCKDTVKLEKILTWMNKAIELNANANLLENKAKILVSLNKREEAIITYEAALVEYKSTGLSGDWLVPKIEALKKGEVLPKEEDE